MYNVCLFSVGTVYKCILGSYNYVRKSIMFLLMFSQKIFK